MTPRTIRERIGCSGFSQAAVAREIRIDPSLLNRRLNGRRCWPAGFEADILAAIERLTAAEAAARSARDAVLSDRERLARGGEIRSPENGVSGSGR